MPTVPTIAGGGASADPGLELVVVPGCERCEGRGSLTGSKVTDGIGARRAAARDACHETAVFRREGRARPAHPSARARRAASSRADRSAGRTSRPRARAAKRSRRNPFAAPAALEPRPREADPGSGPGRSSGGSRRCLPARAAVLGGATPPLRAPSECEDRDGSGGGHGPERTNLRWKSPGNDRRPRAARRRRHRPAEAGSS